MRTLHFLDKFLPSLFSILSVFRFTNMQCYCTPYVTVMDNWLWGIEVMTTAVLYLLLLFAHTVLPKRK